MSPRLLPRLADITAHYDAFLIDLWGVIHDGVNTYPGVHDALRALKSAGKTAIFLSNAPRRATKAMESLARMGIDASFYDHVVTSGEAMWDYAKNHQQPFDSSWENYIYIGPEKDRDILVGLPYKEVTSAQHAQFAITTGFDEDHSTLDEKMPQLQDAIAYKLPLVCANPDKVVVRINGARALCAGVIADAYTDMGGTSHYFGKPYLAVYSKALSYIPNITKSRIAAIGDSLETDIKGANHAGIDSYLIAGGILGEQLGIRHGQLPDAARLQQICDEYGIIPHGVLPAFS